MRGSKVILSAISILVADYDEAISWYCSKLGFELIVDTPMGVGKRWVVVAPIAEAQTRIILAKASGPEQTALIGRQMGGRVGFFLQTDAFDDTYARMVEAGVVFREEPRSEPYGKVVVFEDCYGNGWDLIQPAD
ncbi:MAG: VOC family protein [Aquidulcibacter sp.]|jgi:catechol 2,3-dioxygenase-like lactoylglutathione lyase family enzyme|uniref:VOC family protein n=1 Tax=Aquidulcibacter sp. TaxID=2052990 RepID=UPI0022BBE554|nr:VOC family protein [Aquidulcibacter sp.]